MINGHYEELPGENSQYNDLSDNQNTDLSDNQYDEITSTDERFSTEELRELNLSKIEGDAVNIKCGLLDILVGR